MLLLARLNIESRVPCIEIAHLQRAEFAGGINIDGGFTRLVRPGLRKSQENLLDARETGIHQRRPAPG
jgi:hypothetical protein